MKIQYYRIFLEPITQLSLLPDEAKLSKRDILSKAFDQSNTLYIKSGNLAYKSHLVSGDYIFGSISRRAQVTLNHSPEEDFKQELVDTWPVCKVFINISNEAEIGQSIGIEFDQSVFRTPLVQLRALAEELRKPLYAFGFEMSINPITAEQNFWDIVASAQGRIKDLTFTFAAPNFFQTNDKLNDELREARDTFLMTKATVKLENPDSKLLIPKDNTFVQQGVEYIAGGGGEYKIKVKGRKTYSSSDSVKTADVDEVEIEVASTDAQQLKILCGRVFSWLKSSE